jgi:hypothetical protein
MRHWAERVPVSCQACGRIYVASPTDEGTFCVTTGHCQCGKDTFAPVEGT